MGDETKVHPGARFFLSHNQIWNEHGEADDGDKSYDQHSDFFPMTFPPLNSKILLFIFSLHKIIFSEATLPDAELMRSVSGYSWR